MWDHIYIAEKLAEFRDEGYERRRRRGRLPGRDSGRPPRKVVARLGRMLVRLGTRLQEWSRAPEIPGVPAAE